MTKPAGSEKARRSNQRGASRWMTGHSLPQVIEGELAATPFLRRLLADEHGQALIFTILCMTCLFGFVAMATDVGTLLHQKRLLQIAADSGAIAGALELNYGDATTAAQAATAQNGATNGANGVSVSVNTPPLYGPPAANSNYVEVIVSQVSPTFFMNIFGKHSITVTAKAVATMAGPGGCVYTLGASGADISAVGNTSISVATCGIVDDSSSSDALSITGNATLTAKSIGIVGGASETGNVSVTPTPVTGIVPASNPLAFLPAPTLPAKCPTGVSLSGDNPAEALTPGCYSQISLTGNTSVTLSAGTYIIDGPLSLTGNATMTGTNVTLYLLGSTTMTGNIALNLTAPTTGTYSGILFYQPPSNTNPISIVGNSGATLKGIIYAPGAAVSFTGNSGSTIYTDFVVNSLSMVGNSSFQDYATLAGTNSPLTSATLVE